uniref:SH2 domain-containing protein n=1 Tax=Gallus gallus TaxID=9031 RepID=A0A8V0Y0K6_CHICK
MSCISCRTGSTAKYCIEMGAPDGSFLVRESETFVGDYVLSIWCDEKVQHFRIHWRQDTNIHRFLTDNLVFDSLYNLITHYRETLMRYILKIHWAVLTTLGNTVQVN